MKFTVIFILSTASCCYAASVGLQEPLPTNSVQQADTTAKNETSLEALPLSQGFPSIPPSASFFSPQRPFFPFFQQQQQPLPWPVPVPPITQARNVESISTTVATPTTTTTTESPINDSVEEEETVNPLDSTAIRFQPGPAMPFFPPNAFPTQFGFPQFVSFPQPMPRTQFPASQTMLNPYQYPAFFNPPPFQYQLPFFPQTQIPQMSPIPQQSSNEEQHAVAALLSQEQPIQSSIAPTQVFPNWPAQGQSIQNFNGFFQPSPMPMPQFNGFQNLEPGRMPFALPQGSIFQPQPFQANLFPTPSLPINPIEVQSVPRPTGFLSSFFGRQADSKTEGV